MPRQSPSALARLLTVWACLLGLALAPGARPGSVAPPAGQAPAGAGGQVQDAPGVQDRPQDVVVEILVEGEQRYTESQLRAALGQRIGAPYDTVAVGEGLRVLFETFRVLGTVSITEVEGGIAVLLQVRELPLDLEPRFIGNVEVDTEELLEWARLEPGSELYLFEAPRIRDRLLDAYRREGFHFVEIRDVIRSAGTTAEGEEVIPDVIFQIREGPQVHVKDVVIHGNESMPDRGALFWREGLRKFADVELDPPRFWLFKDEYVEEVLLGDLQAMRQVYRDRGWLDAVVQLERLEFSDDRGWVTIHIVIDEGPRYQVGTLSVQGGERREPRGPDGAFPWEPTDLLFPEEELLELCELKPGAFFEDRVVQRDVRSLRDHYGERGYVFHPSLPELERWDFLGTELVFEEGEPVVNVVYRIAQGRQQFLREILITGNHHTRDRVIRGRVTVEPGEVADLTEIEQSRARIQSLGFFTDRRPDVEHNDPEFRFLETDDPAWKDLEYAVEETNALSLNVSGGVTSNAGVFGLIQASKRNFDLFDPPSSLGSTVDEVSSGRAWHGAGQSLRILAAPGTETTSFAVRWTEPDIFRRYDDRIGLNLEIQRRLRIYRSHDEEREEQGFSFSYQLGPDSFVNVGYTFGEIEVDDLAVGGEPTIGSPLPVPRLLKDQEGESDMAWLSFGYQHRSFDDFFSPQRGFSFDTNVQVHDEALGSDYNFVKAFGSLELIGQFGEESRDAQPGWRMQFTGGLGVPYGATQDVPYSERFFIGGLRSVRGFQFRGIGPLEKGFPVGGETMATASFEYRVPLIKTIQPGSFREAEVVRGGLFLDAGVTDPDPFSLDLDELRVSAGFLIGLSVPLPITFSIGFPIKEEPGDDTRVVDFDIRF